MLSYEIVSHHEDFVVVRFFRPGLPAYEHRIRRPLKVKDEDYEAITLPRQIVSAMGSVLVKMVSRRS